MTKFLWIGAIAVAALGGCAIYHPRPLPTAPDYRRNLAQLTVDTRRLPFPQLRGHHFDATDGLDLTEVATLAVVNNPDLRAARDRAGVAHAQAFAAGLLPDPQLGASQDFPRESDPTLVTAYGASLAYDINALIASAPLQAARAQARSSDLELLWAEWQVIAKARLLFVQVRTHARQAKLLGDEQALFRDRYERTHAAVVAGNLAADEAGAYLAALQSLEQRRNDLERRLNDERHALDALLGLAPDVKLDLRGDMPLPALDVTAVRALLPGVPQRRFDLLALQAGYRAQEARVRQAIFGQFPALNLGITAARDTGGVRTLGYAIALTLPLFDGNRGAIAVARATRQRLYDEYQSRLDVADSDADRLLAADALLDTQARRQRQTLAELGRTAASARAAYDAGLIDALHYTDIETALIEARLEADDLDLRRREQRIALQTVIGATLPLPRVPEEKSP
jgi:outer membrane protein TolC